MKPSRVEEGGQEAEGKGRPAYPAATQAAKRGSSSEEAR